MSEIMIAFRKKFKIEELMIYETDYWIWSLRPHQATLGAGILSLKRTCSVFSELNKEEYSDLHNMIKVIEKSLKDLFRYDIMNYLMLMMIDKQVHFHIIPRYSDEIKMFEAIWEDNSWPGVHNLAGEPLDTEKLLTICSYIKKGNM